MRRIWTQCSYMMGHQLITQRLCGHPNENIPQSQIARRGTVEWQTKNQALTPLGFLLWGFIEGQVRVSKSPFLAILKKANEEVFTMVHAERTMRASVSISGKKGRKVY
ncbi:hypothetical protein D918_02359 [Trichuris suis]|nr:hypothetical protein D918_02359 [Trichuris suis]